MKRLSALIALVVPAMGLLHAGGADAEWVNRGNLTIAPQIDARRVVNLGTITLPTGTKPFETSNTEVYLNEGTISGNPGIRFRLVDDSGFTRPSTLFSNSPAGTIATTNSFFGGILTPGLGGLAGGSILNIYRSVADAFLSIEADTIVNRGALVTSAGGEIRIKGRNIDLAGSAVNVTPLPDGISLPDDEGGVRPIPGQLDTYWRYDQTRVVFSDLMATLPIPQPTPTGTITNTNALVSTPNFPYTAIGTDPNRIVRTNFTLGGFLGGTLYRDIHPFVWITTNAASATSLTNSTNQVITVLLVRVPDTNVLVEAVTVGGPDPANFPLPTVRLRLTSVGTNLITGQNDAVSFIVQNTFSSDPQNLLLSNSISGNTYQPTNLLMFKRTTVNVPNPFPLRGSADTNAYRNGVSNLLARIGSLGRQTSNAAFRPDLFTHYWGFGSATNLSYTNNVATNAYVGYGAQFTYQGSTIPRPANVPYAAPTNLAGRVIIEGDKVDLRRTRVRAQGPVILRANELVTSSGSSIDAPFMDVAIKSPTDDLRIQNLFRSSIDRFAGNLQVFSTVWSNGPPDQTVTVTNAPTNPGDPPTTTDVTVPLSAYFHVMIVDADFSASVQTPFVDLKLESKNVTISDGLQVSRFASVKTENLTIDGSLSLLASNGGEATTTWDRAAFPLLKNLTNNGVIQVFNTANFGEAAAPYQSLVNNGSIITTGAEIFANDIVTRTNSLLSARFGRLDITGDRVTMRGRASAMNVLTLKADALTLGGGGVFSADYIDAAVTGSLTVETNGAAFNTTYGVNFGTRPGVLNARGLTISTRTPAFQESVLVWPGVDIGNSTGGFGDESIAVLDLDAGPFSTITIRGAGNRNALYVRSLVLSTNIATTNGVGGALVLADPGMFNIADGMTVYFTAANVPGRQLETLTGGKFTFVETRSGGATVLALVNGKPTEVSIASRFSTRLDSDGDGIVNAYDADPYEGVVTKPNVVVENGAGFVVQWEAAPWSTYEVQYSDNLSGEWQTLQRVTNPEGSNRALWIRDPIRESDGGRTYRVLTK